MTVSPVGANLLEPLDILPYLHPQLAFQRVLLLEDTTDRLNLLVGELTGPLGGVNLGSAKNFRGPLLPDSVDSSQGNMDWFLIREINPCDSCHTLALYLLVVRIRTNDTHPTVPSDDLAFVAPLFD